MALNPKPRKLSRGEDALDPNPKPKELSKGEDALIPNPYTLNARSETQELFKRRRCLRPYVNPKLNRKPLALDRKDHYTLKNPKPEKKNRPIKPVPKTDLLNPFQEEKMPFHNPEHSCPTKREAGSVRL